MLAKFFAIKNLKSIEQLLSAYANGERHFFDCDIDGSLKATNLKGVIFQECFFLCDFHGCLLYTSPSPRDRTRSRMPSSA